MLLFEKERRRSFAKGIWPLLTAKDSIRDWQERILLDVCQEEARKCRQRRGPYSFVKLETKRVLVFRDMLYGKVIYIDGQASNERYQQTKIHFQS
jgi:hypothetical protein